ncbi:MAG: ribonuclease III, partial [Candidatus Binatia bacterium]
MTASIDSLEAAIGHRFERKELLSLALTHRSSAGRVGLNNENLEFLGDSVLSLAVSDLLIERFPEMSEGRLSKLRASVVNSGVLAIKALAIDLGRHLRLGKGEDKSGGRQKESILASTYEAVLGAVFLDGGFAAARTIVAAHFDEDLRTGADRDMADPKTRLQELTQRRFRSTPVYTLVRSTGPDHARAFESEITIEGRVYGRGEG